MPFYCILTYSLYIYEEFQTALHASLQTKVASLEEDKWIYEGGS